ncbi:hypothetical protein [Nocardia australiensis]|uniref:hypothetical protein n=1 Tax=Nocardia australiensis TaxID=2887191 RepID=UPI001D158623|nr:hypothetical protein [Nocardia australiensis]
MKLIWMAAPALAVAAVSGCSDGKSSTAAVTSTVASPATTAPAANSETTAAAPSEVRESDGGVRITLGETKMVVVPADAVMDIKVPAEWGSAVSSVRCAVTDSTGRNEDLRSSDVKKRESIAGSDWLTIWTFSSPPAAEVTVGCKTPDPAAPVSGKQEIRVVPRGLSPQ